MWQGQTWATSKEIFLYGVHPLSDDGLRLQPNFQKRGPDKISIFGGRLLEKKMWPFWAGGGRDHSFYIKNKLKPEILNDKKPQKTTNQNVYLP